jgi:hypothetical protein
MNLRAKIEHWHNACFPPITGLGRCSNYKFRLFNQESINA